jgi:hypothetical protein
MKIGALVLTMDPKLPENVLYPSVVGRSGPNGTGIRGRWRARADRVSSIYAARIKVAGTVSGEELEAIDTAVAAFLSSKKS